MIRGMWWLVLVVIVAAIMATYLTWTAKRVERLHVRASNATSALWSKLDDRAYAARELADTESPRLGGYTRALRVAARCALESLPEERDASENDLTTILRHLPIPVTDGAMVPLVAVSERLAIAKQVHTDVVRDAMSVRRRWFPRVLGFTRHFEEPRYLNIDDPRL